MDIYITFEYWYALLKDFPAHACLLQKIIIIKTAIDTTIVYTTITIIIIILLLLSLLLGGIDNKSLKITERARF